MACRIVFALGGHNIIAPRLRSGEPSIRERQVRLLRNLFWLVYVVDKEIALRTGQPLIIYDEFCDLTLPDGYTEQHSMAFFTNASDHKHGVPSFPGDITLSILKAKTCRVLYSVEASHKSDVELLRSIRELDEDLENWLTSVPERFAPTRSAKNRRGCWGQGSNADQATNMRRTMLNLEYHHLMVIIHSAAGRCMKPALTNSTETRFVGLELSLQLSVEASRATLAHIGTAANEFPAEAFW